MWLESARLIGDWKSEGICLSGMANVYECWGQYQQAIHCYQESLKVRRKGIAESGDEF
ncbi:MAG: tetratricopeptide repeat protein [Nostoc sp. ChiSLP02]|nr:tetratricopeptide repeat protein [Nostoc sp. DedSLP05]MDZ8101639.1 tetratricopeptide repeat protein [Nostoc sp. DedSLP01]MDZ8188274.1 tetratricopeptide repeat protein [Nostoc sp. ChiSLP02]